MEDAPNVGAYIVPAPAGTWMVPVTLGARWAKLAWRMGIASAVTAWLFYLQFQDNAPAAYMLWGFGMFALGTFLGVRAFGIRERRVFDTAEVHYTHAQRIRRSARWFVPGLAMLAVIWWAQVDNGQFSTYWWYAWPALFPVLVGVGLYMLQGERVLSAKGQFARAQVDAAQAQVKEQRIARLKAVAQGAPVRYAGAAGCLYMAYLFATESTDKDKAWFAFGSAVVAFILARELGIWLLGVGIACGAAWAFFSGIAALPVSAAVIIGALIIAAAISRK